MCVRGAHEMGRGRLFDDLALLCQDHETMGRAAFAALLVTTEGRSIPGITSVPVELVT